MKILTIAVDIKIYKRVDGEKGARFVLEIMLVGDGIEADENATQTRLGLSRSLTHPGICRSYILWQN